MFHRQKLWPKIPEIQILLHSFPLKEQYDWTNCIENENRICVSHISFEYSRLSWWFWYSKDGSIQGSNACLLFYYKSFFPLNSVVRTVHGSFNSLPCTLLVRTEFPFLNPKRIRWMPNYFFQFFNSNNGIIECRIYIFLFKNTFS